MVIDLFDMDTLPDCPIPEEHLYYMEMCIMFLYALVLVLHIPQIKHSYK